MRCEPTALTTADVEAIGAVLLEIRKDLGIPVQPPTTTAVPVSRRRAVPRLNPRGASLRASWLSLRAAVIIWFTYEVQTSSSPI
jgi:hypothetical protein